MAITSANQLELLQTAEAVAREKMIDPELVIQAMEDSLARAAKSRYGAEMDIRVKIDRKTGRATFTRVRTVVEDEAVENHQAQLTVKQAKDYLADPKIGDEIVDEVPPVDLGRIAAQSAKQVILQKVREAERDRQFEEFKDRKGTIINGAVKREEYGNVIVDIGRGEGILRRNEKIGREAYRSATASAATSRTCAAKPRGPQVFLSRTDPQFMAELFKMEVPEIYDGIIEIKAVARDPGSRAKIAVICYDNSIDPVGACVGMRGSRVQAVVNELQGEKIDIIPWNEDQATFLVNALQPAEVSKVVIDEEAGKIEVVVPDEQLSLAIGRRGQNVRLASQLTGLDIDIMTEAEESAAPSGRVRRTHQAVHGHAGSRRDDGPAAGLRRLHQPRRSRLCRPGRTSVHRRLRRRHRRRTCRPVPATIWKQPTPRRMENARALGVEDSLVELRRPDAADARGAGQGRHQDAGRLRDLRRLGTGRRLDHRERRSARRTKACWRSST